MNIYHLMRKPKSEAERQATYESLMELVIIAASVGEARALAKNKADDGGDDSRSGGNNSEIWLQAKNTSCQNIGLTRAIRTARVVCADRASA